MYGPETDGNLAPQHLFRDPTTRRSYFTRYLIDQRWAFPYGLGECAGILLQLSYMFQNTGPRGLNDAREVYLRHLQEVFVLYLHTAFCSLVDHNLTKPPVWDKTSSRYVSDIRTSEAGANTTQFKAGVAVVWPRCQQERQ